VTPLLFPHLLSESLAFRPPALARTNGAAEACFETIEEGRRAERTTDRFGGAERGEFLLCRPLIKEIGETSRHPLEQRRHCDEAVAAPLQVRARTRPGPILRAPHQPRPHRIERNIACCCYQMRLVEHNRAEAALDDQ
jgi:hypothetical protein